MQIFRNESPAPRVAVRLRGQTPNTAGIGARVTVSTRSLPTQTREVTAGGLYPYGQLTLIDAV